MEIEVEVFSEHPLRGERDRTTRAFVTMVAVDRDGRPHPAPELTLRNDEERGAGGGGDKAPSGTAQLALGLSPCSWSGRRSRRRRSCTRPPAPMAAIRARQRRPRQPASEPLDDLLPDGRLLASDEIDHDRAGQRPQTDLGGDRGGGLQIGRRPGARAAVDVDRHAGGGLLDDEEASRRQRDPRIQRAAQRVSQPWAPPPPRDRGRRRRRRSVPASPAPRRRSSRNLGAAGRGRHATGKGGSASIRAGAAQAAARSLDSLPAASERFDLRLDPCRRRRSCAAVRRVTSPAAGPEDGEPSGDRQLESSTRGPLSAVAARRTWTSSGPSARVLRKASTPPPRSTKTP